MLNNCLDCGCHTPGTIGSVGVCDTDDGQCACKPNVGGTRICDQCYDGFFGLMDINGMGCDPCQCDVGGTQLQRGEEAICDKESGQCRCRPGLMGRKCNEVMDTYYIPTLHQFQHEIEDGYRRDGSPVRIGYDDAKFPGYSWKGYGAYSQLQNEVHIATLVVYPLVLLCSGSAKKQTIELSLLWNTFELTSFQLVIDLTWHPIEKATDGCQTITMYPLDIRSYKISASQTQRCIEWLSVISIPIRLPSLARSTSHQDLPVVEKWLQEWAVEAHLNPLHIRFYYRQQEEIPLL